MKRFSIVFFSMVNLFIGAASYAHNHTSKPSYDCAKSATLIEKEICQNQELSNLDRELAKIYAVKSTFDIATGVQKSQIQKEWLKQRKACVRSKNLPLKPEEISCISLTYQDRIIGLAQSVSLSNFELSEQIISKYIPEKAPYYRALSHYFSIENKNEKEKKIEEILREEFKKLDGENSDWVKSLLAEFGVEKISDGVKSDEKFGYMISMLSSLEAGPIIIPCEAFEAKPGMISALQPIFGSSRDNFLARTDCVIPSEMKNFVSFLGAIEKSAPECEGTMRFGIYRAHQLHIDEILLGRFQELRNNNKFYYQYLKDNSKKDKVFIGFLKKYRPLQKAAAKEIAAYWLKQYSFKSFTASQIEDNLSSLALGMFDGC